MGFVQQLEGIPETYRGLRDMVLDLVKELDQAREERKQFNTGVARKALNDFIGLIVETAEEVSREVRANGHLYLLHNRREPSKDAPPRYVAFQLRHYLSSVVNAAHRKMLTWMVCGQHRLASVRLAYKRNPPILPNRKPRRYLYNKPLSGYNSLPGNHSYISLLR